VDVVKTLLEWRRVLKPGGTLAIVVPTSGRETPSNLDPTHKHCFTPESLERLVTIIGGFDVIRSEIVIRGGRFSWSQSRPDE